MARSVENFRTRYRAERLPKRYNGILHAISTTLIYASLTIVMLALVDGASLLEWMVVPAIFLGSNLFEYKIHQHHLHRPIPGFKALFRLHTGKHHHYYTHEAMAFRDHKDLHMVLLPWFEPLASCLFLYIPMWLVTWWLGSSNAACLAVAASTGYSLMYEVLHFSAHLDPRSRWARIPGMQTLREHHKVHHNPALMGTHNFNITVPLFDWLLGTTWKPRPAMNDQATHDKAP